MPSGEITNLRFDGLHALRQAVASGAPPWREALLTVGRAMQGCWQKHYSNAARGGGDPAWAPLTEETVKRKLAKPQAVRHDALGRRVTAKSGYTLFRTTGPGPETWSTAAGTASIQIDLGLLEKALTPGASDVGTRLEAHGNTVTVGFSQAPHGDDTGDGGEVLTYAKLATIHHEGDSSRNLPARPIFIHPDAVTKRTFQRIIQQALRNYSRSHR